VEVGVPVAVAVKVAIRLFVDVGVGPADPAMSDPSEQPRLPRATREITMMSEEDFGLMMQSS
jgi:hypothetical protein